MEVKEGRGLRIVDRRGVILSHGPAKADSISFFDPAKLGILTNYAVPDFVVDVDGRAVPYKGLSMGMARKHVLNRYMLEAGRPTRMAVVHLSPAGIFHGTGNTSLLVEGRGFRGGAKRQIRIHRVDDVTSGDYGPAQVIENIPGGCGLPDAIWKRKSGGYRVFSRSGCYMHLRDDLQPAND